jgi:phosphoglycolate phosphatase-like HAD superfamily hydrolase
MTNLAAGILFDLDGTLLDTAQAANISSVVARYGYIENLDRVHQWQADLHINHATD